MPIWSPCGGLIPGAAHFGRVYTTAPCMRCPVCPTEYAGEDGPECKKGSACADVQGQGQDPQKSPVQVD